MCVLVVQGVAPINAQLAKERDKGAKNCLTIIVSIRME